MKRSFTLLSFLLSLYLFAQNENAGSTPDLVSTAQKFKIVLPSSQQVHQRPDTPNDLVTKEVTRSSANDIGVVSINSPETGTGLTNTEVVEVTLQNFGGLAQTNFPVSYTLNGVTTTEIFGGTIDVGEVENYSFSQTADLLNLGIYELCATTALVGDSKADNDKVCSTINHSSCLPEAFNCNLDGLKRFVLGTIDIDDGGDGCNTTGNIEGYVDRTNLSTDLDRISGNNTHLLQAQHNWDNGATIETISAWIDFNDDNIFELSEQLIIGENFATANELNDFDLVIPVDAALGAHILRIRVIDPSFDDSPNDPCTNHFFGETHDYMVNIIDSTLNIDEFELSNHEMIVTKVGDKEYMVTLESSIFSDQLVITMHNTLGQRLVRNRVENVGGKYVYNLNLNLNGLSNGVYIIRLGNSNYGKVKRIALY